MLKMRVDGEVLEVDDVTLYDDVLHVEAESEEWVLFPSHEEAGKAARKQWEELARDDPEEFACLVGEDVLVAWALGQYAGPGSTQVRSLDEWLDLWLDTPEDEFAGWDGEEIEGVAFMLDDDEDAGSFDDLLADLDSCDFVVADAGEWVEFEYATAYRNN